MSTRCDGLSPWLDRRRLLQVVAYACLAPAGAVQAQAGAVSTPSRQLREMQIHKVGELGLAIWAENQPPWEAELSHASGHPTFIVQSPDMHHPPAVMTYASWPEERVTETRFTQMATTAIQRASQNFGLNLGSARGITKVAARYGVLSGLEGQFVGRVDGIAMDVKIFVGQANGKFPVALSIYTLEGKMAHLPEVVRRAWGKLAYLGYRRVQQMCHYYFYSCSR